MNALKAFESAARHLSVKLAAEELCVTPGAVSQMIKALEQHLGVRLFEREKRGIYLTRAGREYLPSIRNAFRQIAEASRRVMETADDGVLTVSVTPFFASAWLVPRMATFQQAHPDLDLRIVTGTSLVDFSRSGVDVAIRHGLGRYSGMRCDRVLTVEMVAAAAPGLVERFGLPAGPADLARWPHVHDADRKAWSLWFERNGVDEVGPPRGPSFDDAGLLLKAVLSGQGAGLLPAALVDEEMASRRLVRLVAATYIEELAYYLVCPEGTQDRAKVAAFREWILRWPAARR
ncbi:transcriptional regulator [Trinickia caryophylli]|nr:transcriptional regulator [Trinickia caryophylli]